MRRILLVVVGGALIAAMLALNGAPAAGKEEGGDKAGRLGQIAGTGFFGAEFLEPGVAVEEPSIASEVGRTGAMGDITSTITTLCPGGDREGFFHEDCLREPEDVYPEDFVVE